MAEKTTGGRREDKRKFWEGHVEKWRRSGITQAEYCRRHNLSRKSFTYWKGRMKGAAKSVSFVPVKVVDVPEKAVAWGDAGSSSGIVLYKDGYRIEVMEGFNVEVLGQVLRILGEL
jgi:hypothetical protein